MPEADGANDNPDNGSGGESKEVSGPAPSLDEIHQLNQNKVDVEDDSDEGQDDAESSGDSSDEETGDANDSNDDSDDGSDGVDKDGDTDGKPADKTAPESKGNQDDKSTPVVDTDITQKGQGKIAIKSADGKTYYFNNIAEVPEDFEPSTYAELMRGSEALAEKKQSDSIAANKAKQDEITEYNNQQARNMEKEWETDADDLTSSGLLPKDAKNPKVNEKAREEVIDYMSAEFNKGNVITSFKQAYKSMMYDKEQVAKTKAQKEENDAKKKRGGIVQSGSGGSNSGNSQDTKDGGKIVKAPPSGVTLDQVHNHVTENL